MPKSHSNVYFIKIVYCFVTTGKIIRMLNFENMVSKKNNL